MPGQYHQVYLRSSDPNVVCVSEPVPANDPCHMLIKVYFCLFSHKIVCGKQENSESINILGQQPKCSNS